MFLGNSSRGLVGNPKVCFDPKCVLVDRAQDWDLRDLFLVCCVAVGKSLPALCLSFPSCIMGLMTLTSIVLHSEIA